MLKNYLKTAVKIFSRNKAFTAINILGLSIGISAALVIFLVVQHDYSFDKFEKDGDRIYRIVENYQLRTSGKSHGSTATPDPMGKGVSREITGLDMVVDLKKGNEAKVHVNGSEKVFNNQEKIVFADANYCKMVGYDWLAGNPATSLEVPYQVVLTESNSRLYFPGLRPEQVIGKEIFFDDTVRAVVSGVVKDIPAATIFNYKTILSRVTLETTSLKPRFWDRWDHAQQSMVFVKLSKNTKVQAITSQIATLFSKYYNPVNEDPEKRSFDLQPLGETHFKSYYDSTSTGMADKTVLKGLIAIAAFLVILACINFINLTTAQASARGKEIGIRKTMGSSRKQLITLFMGETFLLTLIAATISVAIAPLLLQAFSAYIPEGITLNILREPVIILFLGILIITVSILAGFYPALIFSSYKTILVLKNQASANSSQSRNAWLRKGLTVSQFVIAQVFIIATLLVSKQINYTLHKEIGMKKDAIIYFGNYTANTAEKKLLLVNKLKSLPGVAMVSLSMDPPSSTSTWIDVMKFENGKKQVLTDVQVKIGDADYIRLYQIKLLAGTNITNNDTMGNLLINETYLHALGFTDPNQIIGQSINVYGNKRVVGVVQDFNQKSLKEAISPLLITGGIESENTFNVALQPQGPGDGAWPVTIERIRAAWKEIYPKQDFEYSFLDESIAAYYASDQNVAVLLKWSTGLTVLISCLGLLGLVIYITNMRKKEIGIRKVIGATVPQIVSLISKDFLKLVVQAFIVAVPIAWYAANEWLQNFAYRTAASWWIFVAGGLFMLAMAIVILAVRTIQAALANPVKSLRMD